MIGKTKDELGGSEYYEYIHNFIGGQCPKVDFKQSKANMRAVLTLIRKNLIKNVHDCSKGGLAVAISELCMTNNIGCNISLQKVPDSILSLDKILFSESHSRYLLVSNKKNIKVINKILKKNKIIFDEIGKFDGSHIIFEKNSKPIVSLSVDKAKNKWIKSLEELVLHG